MGRALAERFPEAMELWKKAEKFSGLPLRGIYWEGDEKQDDTRNLQPALTAVNLGLWLTLASRLRPVGTAGHSLGEYCALAAASVLSPEQVLELAALRGRLMAEADPEGRGAMAAVVKLNLSQAEELVRTVLRELGEGAGTPLIIANYNTPAQFVVSGAREAVVMLVEKAREFKGRAIPLAVSGAFHSPLMEEAAKEMAVLIHKRAFAHPRFPVYCNAVGRAVSDGAQIKDLLLRQMTSPVRWIETIHAMFHDGARIFVECSPKDVLTKMSGQILDPAEHKDAAGVAALTVSGPDDLESLSERLENA
jgi:[acyl-carrier-protein] S-malonyltransferase